VRDEPDAQDVGVAIQLAETEALDQVGAHSVAVENLDLVATRPQNGLKRFGQRRLARA
jgi:hypothetical protein